jgi:nucleoside-diphosphate-sugar epimerase
MTTIAVTGVGGLLGRALVQRLRAGGPDDAHGVDRIIGLDVRVPSGLVTDGGAAPDSAPDVELRAFDVRDPGLVDVLAGVDVVVHLAFQMDPIRDVDEMRSINVDGTMNVMAAARAAGVGRVIYLSSVVAYGAHPDNDVPLTESSPLRGQPGFAYAEHKREVEDLLWLWHAAGDAPALTVLRSAAVFGPGVQNFLTRVLELPALPELPDAPPLQFVHVDDVVGAIVHALTTPIDGAFNVAPDGWLDHARVLALSGRRTLAMEPDRMRRLVEQAHRLGLGELEPGVVELFQHPWLLANDRLRATGWAPTRSNEETLLETVLEHERFVSLGRLRTDRTTLRAAGLAVATLLAAVSVAALRRR